MTRSRFQGVGMTSRRTRQRLVERLRARGITDERVLAAIGNVPRHVFVDEALASRAYEDSALPIGHGQSLSQPYVVARMTELLIAGTVPERVLEIGTGSGYQAAILGHLVDEVYTVERIAPLMRQARDRLYDLRLRNVHVRQSDGSAGWTEQAPFDAILMTASSTVLPETLLEQLSASGRMLLPLGHGAGQRLVLVRRGSDGFEQQSLEPVNFVPMVRGTQ